MKNSTNNTTNTVVISIRCDKQLKANFVKVAMSLDRSLANYLKHVMKDAIKRHYEESLTRRTKGDSDKPIFKE